MPFGYAPMPMPQKTELDIGGNVLRGMAFQNQMSRNELYRRELDKDRRTEEALKGVDWESPESLDKAVKQVMAVNPKMGAELIELKQKGTKQQLEFMKAAGVIAEKFMPAMMNNPMAYKTFHEKYLTPMGLGNVVPKFETFITPDGKIDMDKYNQSVRFIGSLGRLAKAESKEFEPFTLLNRRYQKNPTTGEMEIIAEAPYKESPQTVMVDPEGNLKEVGQPGQRIIKQPQVKDLTPKAHELAMKDVSNNPLYLNNIESPEAQEFYQRRFDFHSKRLGAGGKGTAKQSMVVIRNKKTGETMTIPRDEAVQRGLIK